VNVVVAGGGVGALELVLALPALAGERTRVTLIAPEAEFRYRPTSVAVPFGGGRVDRFPLAEIADVAGARLIAARVSAADPDRHTLVTGGGEQVGYDVLVVACGARRLPVMSGAIAFRGEEDIPAITGLLEDIDHGRARSVVFALPRGASWALPLYELALLTATHVASRKLTRVSLSLVTPEDRPLAQFGGEVSKAVADLLAAHDITIHTATYPVGVYGSVLMLVPAQTLPADRVVCMPVARGVVIEGLPHDREGFLPTDLYGRVAGMPDVFAIGDVTSQPIKQGGIAAQQAEVVAHVLAKSAGAPIDDPQPHRPALRGLLLTGDAPRYLTSEPAGGRGAAASISTEPLWWPGGKIAAPHLGAYLVRTGRIAPD
jgi:sulfide:quinone oxidoreductase